MTFGANMRMIKSASRKRRRSIVALIPFADPRVGVGVGARARAGAAGRGGAGRGRRRGGAGRGAKNAHPLLVQFFSLNAVFGKNVSKN